MKKIPLYLRKKLKPVDVRAVNFHQEIIEGMQITFLGAVETVTGSKYLIEFDNKKILVDCGLFQGYKELRLRNWSVFPVPPERIDAVILTHAHLDHSGYIPLLVKNGFKGKIYCTRATGKLCEILLPDSGYLNEEDARHANKYGYSKHKKALPLYTQRDAYRSLKQFNPIEFNKEYSIFDDFKFSINPVGHILGAGTVWMEYKGKSILFSGDVGRQRCLIMRPPEKIKPADYLVVESTYGNRLHSKEDPINDLGEIINRTVKRGGSVVIPAFAVGRSQNILYFIHSLKKAGKIPNIPVFLDSPMSIKVTNLLDEFADQHCLSKKECFEIYDGATFTATPKESKKIANYQYPIIVISASGMATGGRILHHLKSFAPDHRNTILFTGYQAAGTRGRRIVDGEKEVKIHGYMVPVNAEVASLSNTSAHADYKEMLNWISTLENNPPKKVFISHGEPEAAEVFSKKIKDKFGWNVVVPKYLQKEKL